jgi:CRP-like cAMP-binding protein
MNETIELLRTCEILGGLDRPLLEMLAGIAERRRFALGDALFASGDQRELFWLLVSGHVEVRVESGDAAGTVVILGPGD